MTIANMKRKFPGLIEKAEKSCRLRFVKKPSLRAGGGYPRNVMRATKDRQGIRQATVVMPKRMLRDHEEMSEVGILHELRAMLLMWAPVKEYSMIASFQISNVI